MPLKPHAYLKIQSINGSCFEQYSFPIAITIVIVMVLEVVMSHSQMLGKFEYTLPAKL